MLTNALHLQVKLLTPGSLGLGAPSSPSASQATPTPGMWCQITPPDTITGQTSITFWPLYTLYNAMPGPIYWRLLNTANQTSDLSAREMPEQDAGGVLQPGKECPLAVALQGGQALSFGLSERSIATMHSQDTTSPESIGSAARYGQEMASPHRVSSTSDAAWSVPLEARRHAGSTEANRMFPEARRSRIMLPEAGQKLALSIPCISSGQGSLSVMLTARPGLNQAPNVALCVAPHAVLHNSLPFAVTLACPELPHQATAAPSSSQALDWGPVPIKPKKAILAVLAQGGTTLQSAAFPLDSDHEFQLSFSATPDKSHQSHQILFSAAVGVHTSSLEMPSASAGNNAGSPIEVTHISITPACFVTNLTSHHIMLQLPRSTASLHSKPTAEPAHAGRDAIAVSARDEQDSGISTAPSQTSTALVAEQQQEWSLSCAASQTVPILNAWRLAQLPSTRHPEPKQGASLPNLSAQVVLVQKPAEVAAPGQRARGASPSSRQQSFPPPVTPLSQQSELPDGATLRVFEVQQQSPAAGSELYGSVLLTQPCGRRHLHVLYEDGEEQMPVAVAYQTLLSRGRLHLVFFVDPQPPVMVHNATSEALSVGWAAVSHKHAQRGQQQQQQQFELPAGASLECNSLPGLLTNQTGRVNWSHMCRGFMMCLTSSTETADRPSK